MDMRAHTPVECNYFGDSSKDFYHSGQTKPVHSRKHNAPLYRIAIAMNTNSAITGSYSENQLWYQQFDLRQIRILRGGQPIVDFDAAVAFMLQQ